MVGFDQWWASPFAILELLGDGSILFTEHILNLDSVCACWHWILGRAYSIHTCIELEVLSFKAELDASTWIDKHKLQDAFLVCFDTSQLVELVVHILDVGKVAMHFTVVLVINMVGFDQWWASPFAILELLGDGSILFTEHILNLDSVCACWHWILGRAYSIHTCIELEVLSFKAELDASTWINKHKLQDAFLVRSDASQLVELVVHTVDVRKVAIGIFVSSHASMIITVDSDHAASLLILTISHALRRVH